MSERVNAVVGLRLKKRRLYLLIKQKDLASRLGISYQQLNKYENGVNAIPLARLVDCMAILKVDANYFFCEDDGY